MRQSRRSIGRDGVAAAVVLAACAVVGTATPGLRLLVPTLSSGGSTWAVRASGIVLAAAALAWLAHRSGRGPARRDPRGHTLPGRTTGEAFRRAATIMGLLTLAALFARPPAAPAADGPEPAQGLLEADSLGLGEAPAVTARRARSPGGFTPVRGPRRGGGTGTVGRPFVPGGAAPAPPPEGLLRRIGPFLPPLLFLALAVLAYRVLTQRPGAAGEPAPPRFVLEPADASAGLAASLAEVAGPGPRPRDQITAAYRRILAALAEAGAPRAPHEGPHEHLRRALLPLGVHPAPRHRLTGLYVQVHFSERPVTDAHRAAAAEALAASLAGLRSVHGGPERAASPHPVAGSGHG